jgi:alanyl aminopeptidase
VALRVDPAQAGFSGTEKVTVRLAASTSAIVMHARKTNVTSATATAAGTTTSATLEMRAAAGTKGDAEELVLSFARPLPPGDVELSLAWDAPYDESLQGLYKVVDDGRPYAFTQMEPADARRVFPCFDEPGFKTPFDLTLTVPKGQLAVANTRELSRADAGTWTTFRFATTAPLPTYLVAFAVGALDVREGPAGKPAVRLIATRGKGEHSAFALEATRALTATLEGYFGLPYPFDKLDVVAVPDFGAGAMENAGLVTFREELLLIDAAHSTVAHRKAAGTTIAHELAHQWFGDLVTSAWWDDLWLNEGFATWMGDRATAEWRPSWHVEVDSLEAKYAAMALDVLPGARAVRQPVTSTSDALEAFDGVTYDKGAALLRMLESWLGKDAFRQGIRDYVRAHANGTATSADLLAALGKASGKDVAAVARTFLDQPGVPLVTAEVACDGGRASVRLAQRPLRARSNVAPHASTWTIPACFVVGSPRREACVELGAEPKVVPVDGACPSWVWANAHEGGYYRALAPRGKALADAVKDLDAFERAGLVTSAAAAFQAGETDVGEVLAALDATRGATERVVLGAQTSALSLLAESVADDKDRALVARLASRTLEPAFARLGWGPDEETRASCPRCTPASDDETTATRELVLTTLGRLGDDRALLAEARRRAELVLAGSPRISQENGAIALRLAARHGDAKLFDAIATRARTAPSPGDRILALRALSAFEDQALLRRALDLALSDAVRIQDARYLIERPFAVRATRDVAYAWLEQSWDTLRRKLPSWLLPQLLASVDGACTAAERARRVAFLEPRSHDVEGADRELVLGLSRADACIDARSRGAATLARLLAR